jgi:lysozyme family protein
VKSNFNDCLNRLLKDEGGYSNVPGDNGGPTNFGITIFDYRKYINPRATATDVKKMSVDQAKAIYKSKYWDALGCDTLTSGVDYTVFDYGVNSGLGRPQKALQRFKSKVGADLINAINDERTAFLKAIGVGHNAQFLRGWMSRVSRVRMYSLHLAEQMPQTPKVAVGLLAGVAAMFGRGKEAVITHPFISVGVFVAVAALAYTIFHFYHKAKQ